MTAWNDDDDDGDWDESTETSYDDDDGDGNDDEGGDTVKCPHCGKQVYEDAEQCPSCGKYISDEDAPTGRKTIFMILGTIVCLYIIIRWIAG